MTPTFPQNLEKLIYYYYILGPISSEAELELCLSPEKFQYQRPMTDLKIHMEELCVQLTKFQYYNFMMLLQSLEYMSRASQFRKYKARYDLENLPNYSGKAVQLWKFAYWSILEEFIGKCALKIYNQFTLWILQDQYISPNLTYFEFSILATLRYALLQIQNQLYLGANFAHIRVKNRASNRSSISPIFNHYF